MSKAKIEQRQTERTAARAEMERLRGSSDKRAFEQASAAAYRADLALVLARQEDVAEQAAGAKRG